MATWRLLSSVEEGSVLPFDKKVSIPAIRAIELKG